LHQNAPDMQLKKLFSLAGGFALLLVFMGCHKPEAPEYYGFQNLSLGKGLGQETVLSANVKFYNPNPFSLQLKRAEMNISINGKPSGHSFLDSTIFIPKRDTFFVPVALQLDLHSIFNNALQMLLDKQVKIVCDGRVKLKRDGVSFSVPFHYEGDQDMNSLFPSGY
jgi:LEA14-like dessication related protein